MEILWVNLLDKKLSLINIVSASDIRNFGFYRDASTTCGKYSISTGFFLSFFLLFFTDRDWNRFARNLK